MSEIEIATTDGPVQVRAQLFGIYAVHQPTDGFNDGWRVTHVPSGLRFGVEMCVYLTEDEAIAAARLLADRLPDLTPMTATPENRYIAESCFAEALS